MKMNNFEYKPKKRFFLKVVLDAIKNIWIKFHSFGKQEHSIMLIPHDETETIDIHISNYFIIIAIFIALTLPIFSFLVYKTKTSFSINDYNNIRTESENAEMLIEKYSKTVDELDRSVEAYRATIRQIYKTAGEVTPVSYVSSKTLNDKENELIKNGGETAFTLYKIENELTSAKKHLSDIEKLVNTHNNLLSALPTGWPVKNRLGIVTSKFGPRLSPFTRKRSYHSGVDIAHIVGMPVIATGDGKVIYSGYRGGYGYCVIIQHEFGYKTVYGHNYRLTVRAGQKVKKGQEIAKMGQSGRATGPHVHYEVRLGDDQVDPWPYMTLGY